MSACVGSCSKHNYHMQNDCCKVRWLAGCFAPHAPAMLDRWQQQDEKTLGQVKAIERRKAIVKMAKSFNKVGGNE
jgi:hypothetical protein